MRAPLVCRLAAPPTPASPARVPRTLTTLSALAVAALVSPAATGVLLAQPISEVFAISDGSSPSVAFDQGRNRSLVAYVRPYTSGASSVQIVVVRLVGAAGTAGPELCPLGHQQEAGAPRIAYNRAVDEFLLAYERAGQSWAQRLTAGSLEAVGEPIVLGAAGVRFVVADDRPAVLTRWFVGTRQHVSLLSAAGAVIAGPIEAAPGAVSVSGSLGSNGVLYLAYDYWFTATYPWGGTYSKLVSALAAVGENGSVHQVSADLGGAFTSLASNFAPTVSCSSSSWTCAVTWTYRDMTMLYTVQGLTARRLRLTNGEALDAGWDIGISACTAQGALAPDASGGWLVVSEDTKTFLCEAYQSLSVTTRWWLADGAQSAASAIRSSDASGLSLDQQADSGVAVRGSTYYGAHLAVWTSAPGGSSPIVLAARVTSASRAHVRGRSNLDGMGGADRIVVRPEAGDALAWYVARSSGGAFVARWGAVGDVPVPADYDGDGRDDLAVWRPATGRWYLATSAEGTKVVTWGAGREADVPVPADYDGDGRADIAVWRPGIPAGTFYVVPSSTGTGFAHAWGQDGDVPVTADYDGDGRTDFSVWRPSTGSFYVCPSGGTPPYAVRWGAAGDEPIAGDFDGDGRDDLAVYRPGNPASAWYLVHSSTGLATGTAWGTFGDLAVPADHDGDGVTDIAVWRPAAAAATYYVINSSGGATAHAWGTAFDIPIAR